MASALDRHCFVPLLRRRLLQPGASTGFCEYGRAWVTLPLPGNQATAQIAQYVGSNSTWGSDHQWLPEGAADVAGAGDGWRNVRAAAGSQGPLHQLVVQRCGDQPLALAGIGTDAETAAGSTVLHDCPWCRISALVLPPGAVFDREYAWPSLLLNPAAAFPPAAAPPPHPFEFIIGDAVNEDLRTHTPYSCRRPS